MWPEFGLSSSLLTHSLQPEHISSHRPIILDENYQSPETAALHEEGYEGALVARADSPTDLIPMSAYGKPQPPQLHGECILNDMSGLISNLLTENRLRAWSNLPRKLFPIRRADLRIPASCSFTDNRSCLSKCNPDDTDGIRLESKSAFLRRAIWTLFECWIYAHS